MEFEMNIWTHLAAYSLIETQRLYLRPFLFEDAEDFYKIASNPENLLLKPILLKLNMY